MLSKPKRQRLRQTQVYNEHSDSRCWAKQRKKDWEGDKSRMSRLTRGVERHKEWKYWDGDKTTTRRATQGPKQTKPNQQRLRRRQVYNEQNDSRSQVNQSHKEWDWDKSTTSRVTRGPKQTKTTKREMEAIQQRLQSLKVLSKTKQYLRSKSNVWALWGRLLLDR